MSICCGILQQGFWTFYRKGPMLCLVGDGVVCSIWLATVVVGPQLLYFKAESSRSVTNLLAYQTSSHGTRSVGHVAFSMCTEVLFFLFCGSVAA